MVPNTGEFSGCSLVLREQGPFTGAHVTHPSSGISLQPITALRVSVFQLELLEVRRLQEEEERMRKPPSPEPAVIEQEEAQQER